LAVKKVLCASRQAEKNHLPGFIVPWSNSRAVNAKEFYVQLNKEADKRSLH